MFVIYILDLFHMYFISLCMRERSDVSFHGAVSILHYPSFQWHCHSTNIRLALRKTRKHVKTIPLKYVL